MLFDGTTYYKDVSSQKKKKMLVLPSLIYLTQYQSKFQLDCLKTRTLTDTYIDK